MTAVHVRNPQPAFRRAVIALNGGSSDARIVRLVADLARQSKARADRRPRRRDRLDAAARRRHRGPLRGGPARPRHRPRRSPRTPRSRLEPVLLQARDVGAAIVDEATERDADLLVIGLPFRKRFGGDFAIGRTIPYVLQNAPCAVWVVREPMSEEAS